METQKLALSISLPPYSLSSPFFSLLSAKGFNIIGLCGARTLSLHKHNYVSYINRFHLLRQVPPREEKHF